MAWRGLLVESFYGSQVELVAVDGVLSGCYEPPATLPDGANAATFVGLGHNRGLAKLCGSASAPREDGTMTFVGRWEHVQGPFKGQGGSFELEGGSVGASDGAGAVFDGWWELEDERYGWKWQLLHSGEWGGAPRPMRERLAMLAHSVHMDRFGMLCAWLFAVLTSLQLLASVATWAEGTNSALNFACNVVYSALYAAFLCAYAAMHTRPAQVYVLGVALYTAGYVCFAVLYIGAAAALYHAGAWLFLVGSLLLMHTTVPPPLPRGSSVSWRQARFSPARHGAVLWWGAASFATGSVVFALDAADSGDSMRVNIGLALFTIGRLFFILGSVTARCDIFLRGARKHGAKVDVTRTAAAAHGTHVAQSQRRERKRTADNMTSSMATKNID